MLETFNRPAWTLALSLAAAGALPMGAARAQSTPAFGPPSVSTVAPALPPTDFSSAPPSSSGGSASAPLASSPQGCQQDISRISTERLSAIDALNKLAKANKGKLDPVAACPRFRTLVKIETEFRDYLVKNKDWCGVPDQIVDTVQQSTAKDAATSVKACALAVEFKKAQQAAAQGLAAQAPKLPTGPL
jgi:hypothetical protein